MGEDSSHATGPSHVYLCAADNDSILCVCFPLLKLHYRIVIELKTTDLKKNCTGSLFPFINMDLSNA